MKEYSPPKKERESEQEMMYYGARIVVCKGCNNKFYESIDRDMLITFFSCWHTFCLPCTNKYINSEFVNKGATLKCLDPECNVDI